jgi:hypothetical protein
MGYGLLTLKKEECFVLNDAPPVDGAPVATIGAGVSCCDARMTSFTAGHWGMLILRFVDWGRPEPLLAAVSCQRWRLGNEPHPCS